MFQKIISGGQTGVDRAVLDVAIKFDIPHGSWIPKGWKTEDGVLPDKYQLREMPPAAIQNALKRVALTPLTLSILKVRDTE
ncbi:MAG: hypothetical protein ISS59_03760 [Desulfobacteraceae bacterium]|nr:hypothetical protein [Desulfobacteraceae bacterium]